MITQRVRVSVPATSANLGPGFDSIGVALALRGEVELAVSEDQPVPGEGRGSGVGGRGTIPNTQYPTPFPSDRAVEMAVEAARRVFQLIGRPLPPLRASFHGDVPHGRGLGASAILRVGAVVAANALARGGLDREQLLQLASEQEGHADNATPALFGGLQVVVWEADRNHPTGEGAVSGGSDGLASTPDTQYATPHPDRRVTHVQVPVPHGLSAVLFVPELEMPTDYSRRLLPETLSRQEAVHNIGRAALLVAGLATGRLDVLNVATQDVLHQPARSQLFPAMFDIFAAAREAGALCAYLSGGGSTVLALARGNQEQIAEAMASAGAHGGAPGRTILTALSERGAEVEEHS